ncbi:hypothetical protein CEP52_005216 [Fusarium oligoseptatum]|uniref:Uncharacterized protein n=1 Tax=Fusarium oligoseptatum TaxID=2604345 RepID=A0A428TZF2_9HYPO|nr:hypothetical protein CEP52_005216 [Fusarium oligoseptatum]
MGLVLIFRDLFWLLISCSTLSFLSTISAHFTLHDTTCAWHPDRLFGTGTSRVQRVTFCKTFAPIPNEGMRLTLILDMISFGYIVIGAPIRKTGWRKFAVVEGLAKDLIGQGVTATKDRLAAYVPEYPRGATSLVRTLSAPTTTFYLLKKVIADGKFVDASLDLLTAEEIDQQARRAIYGQLIPYAWAVKTSESSPFRCFSDDNGFDETFYLLSARGKDKYVDGDLFTGFKCRDFTRLSGIKSWADRSGVASLRRTSPLPPSTFIQERTNQQPPPRRRDRHQRQ